MRSLILPLAQGLKAKKFSATELTRAYLKAIEKYNPSLNAYCAVTAEQAVRQAAEADKAISRGQTSPLAGIPFILKDNICTEGAATSCCSAMLADYLPPYSATVCERLKNCGAVLLGKGNMDEFAMGSTGETSVHGAALNPYDLSRVAGGSSGGVASAVSGGIAAYGLGSDTGGSVRQPSSFCGVVGFKPTYGSVSRYGLVAYASSFDQIGPIASSVSDVALVFDAIRGADGRDMTCRRTFSAPTALGADVRGLKIGIIEELLVGLSDGVRKCFEEAICAYERGGATIIKLSVPEISSALSAYYIIACAEASSNLARYDGVRYGMKGEGQSPAECAADSRSRGFGSEVKKRIMLGTFVLSGGYRERYYATARAVRSQLCDALSRCFEKCGAIMSPTVPVVAFKRGYYAAFAHQTYQSDALATVANLAMLPSVSIPCGISEGLPVGLQIMSAPFNDAVALSAAYHAEYNQLFDIPSPLNRAHMEEFL